MDDTRSPTANINELLAHAGWLRRLAAYLARGAEEGEELVQETWLATARHPPDATRPARPWLAEVMRNLARMRHRRLSRQSAREAVTAQAVSPPPGADELMIRVEAQRLAAELVVSLDEPYRSTVLLRFFEDRSTNEIARLHDVAPATVRWRLKIAVDRLRDELDGQYRGGRRAWMLAVGLEPDRLGPGLLVKGASIMAKVKTTTLVLGLALLLVTGGGFWWGIARHARQTGHGAAAPSSPAELASAAAWRRSSEGAEATAGEGSGDVAGRVLGPGGQVIAGAVVKAFCLSTRGRPPRQGARATPGSTTGADGRFRIAGLTPCLYALSAGAEGFVGSSRLGVEVKSGTNLQDVDLQLGEGGFTLSGRVMDASSGPIPGAVVRLNGWVPSRVEGIQGRHLWETVTDQQGRYHAQVLRARYDLVALADGYGPGRAFVDVAGNETHDFRLAPAAQLLGRVIIASDRTVVAGAEVRAEGTEGEALGPSVPFTTDGEGRFNITGLAPGPYRLIARKGTLVAALAQPVVVAAASVTRDLELALAPGLVLEGTVRARGKAVSGADVQLGARTSMRLWALPPLRGVSDQTGRFSLDGVLPGEYRLTLAAPGFPPFQMELSMRQSLSKVIELEDHIVVSGRVFTSRGDPARGAQVQAWVQPRDADRVASAGLATADDQGRFELARLGPGDLTLRARHRGEIARIEAQPVAAGERRDLVVRLAAGATVSGVVTWDDGSPADGIRILSLQGGWGVEGDEVIRTAADGSFTAGPFSGGIVSVVAQSTGGSTGWGGPTRPDQAEVKVSEGEQKTGIRLVVSRRARSIGGLVLDGRGRPLAGASVSAALEVAGRSFKRSAQSHRTLTANDGSFTIDDLPAGVYTLFAGHPEHAEAARTGVAAGAADVRLTLGRAGTLAGVVVNSEGKPLSSYSLLVVPPSIARETAAMRLEGAPGQALPIPISNPAGAFELAGLAPGSYDLHASTADGLHGNIEGVPVVAGERRANLRIVVAPGARVTGRVLEIGTRRPLVADLQVPGEVVQKTRSDASGVFMLENVAPASERMLEVRTPIDDHVRERWTIAVPGGQGTVDIGTVWLLPGPDRRLEPRGGGTGLYLGRTPTQITIFQVRPGSPGERSGIRPGDRLLAIDGRDVQQFGLRAAGVLMMGDPGTPVAVSVARPGRAAWDVTLIRGAVER
jgi:RNA polymerase sigma factor (sigma-70 family)